MSLAHLVEAQDLHALERFEPRADVGHLLHVVVAVGQARHQHEAHPHRPAERREPAGVVERRLERLARDLLVDRRIAGLDVEQVEIDRRELVVGELFAEAPRRVQARVQSELLAAPEDLHDERPLHHRLAARQRDAALADLEHLRVLADLAHRARHGHRLAVVLVPGIRVVAVLAAQQAAGQEADEAQAGAVDRAAHFPRVHVADEVVALLDLLDVARMDCVVVERDLALLRALARDVQVVAAADERVAHGALLHRAVEGAIDDVELLLLRELDEVHRVAGHPDRQLRVLLRVLHRVLQRLAVEHVDVHVEAAARRSTRRAR